MSEKRLPQVGKLIDPMTVMWGDSEFTGGLSVFLKPRYWEMAGIPVNPKNQYWCYHENSAEFKSIRFDEAVTIESKYAVDSESHIFTAIGERSCLIWTGCLVPADKVYAYHAAIATKKGKAKPPKPDPLAQAIAEAKERLAGLQDLQAKLSKQVKDKAEAKALAAEIAALRAKYPIEPKAAKAGRKVK